MTDVRTLRVLRISRTIFIPLPASLWRPIDSAGCSCPYCLAHPDKPPYWDTLAVAAEPPEDGADCTWTVHMPEAHDAGARHDAIDQAFDKLDALKPFFESDEP